MTIPSEAIDVLSKIHQKKVVLFVGNGASVDVGGPKTKELVQIIKNSFPRAEYKGDDFIQTCTDVLETTLTSRIELEELIKEKLYDLKPGDFHTELPLHAWPAIFTTNYDDLIEQGYRKVESRVQNIDPVFSDRDLITLNDSEKVKLFKLMGCIVSQHPENKLAITRSDYTNVLRSHPLIFKTLNDLMRDGTILYVGYSFQDYLLLDVIQGLQSSMGDRLPYSYGLFPDLDLASIRASKLRERRIIPLKITATQFTSLLKTGAQPKLVPIRDKPGVTVVVKGQGKSISHQDMRMYLQSFDFLFEQRLTELQPDDIETRRDFFRGLLTDWTGFVRLWDFVRMEYDAIAERAKAELDNHDVSGNKSILVLGPAGSGKTWMLRRLALDAYRAWGNPVVILRPYYEDIDLKLLASLCEELSYSERGKKVKLSTVRARVLIIMENIPSHVTDFKIIATFMKSRGIPVLVVGSARENEWQIACGNLSEQPTHQDAYVLSDTFESGQERIQFASHLSRLGILDSNLNKKEISDLIVKDYQNSFFASVYSLIEPARPLLDTKIKEEYNNLPPLARSAYLLVASFYQYGLPMPITLLVRALGCSYSQFIEQIFQTEAKKIICDVEAPLEGSYLGTRLRIIAEKLIEKEISDSSQLTEVLKKILSQINGSNSDEVQICRTLLIRHLGVNVTDRRFSKEQVRALFKTALEAGRLEDSAVFHHFGLFESANGRQDVALELTNQALKLAGSRNILAFMRSERVENIYNTMGLIHARMAEEAERTGDIGSAENLYETATDYFTKAKGGELQTPHPYDCEARMHYYRAQRTIDPTSKVIMLFKSLDAIHDAEDNLPDESLPRLLELRAEIRELLNKVADLDRIILKLQETPGHEIDGALAGANFTLLNPISAKADRQRALDILDQLIPTNSNNPGLLRTYYRLCKDLRPNDREALYKILNLRYQIPSEKRNFAMLYDLGTLSFSFEDYSKSLECFRLLEKLSQGHPKRWGILDRGTDKDGRIREFQGTIVRIESASMGQVDIPELRRKVPFLPYAQNFAPQVGENVAFKIGFNYRGWLAVDLSK